MVCQSIHLIAPEDSSLPSKQEILIIQESGVSVCVLNLPTVTILADHFLECSKSNLSNTDGKTLSVAKEAEVHILFKAILTKLTSIHGNTPIFVILSQSQIPKTILLVSLSLKNMLKLSKLIKCHSHLELPMNLFYRSKRKRLPIFS